MQIEKDRVEILSGVRKGLTLGSPLALFIRNLDWVNWKEVMSPEVEEIDPRKEEERKVTRPRPGHADLAGGIKYRFSDFRNVLERASARETAARVAAGAVARALLEHLDCRIFSHVVQIGNVKARLKGEDYQEVATRPKSPLLVVLIPSLRKRWLQLSKKQRKTVILWAESLKWLVWGFLLGLVLMSIGTEDLTLFLLRVS